MSVTIIGAGPAGCEAACRLAEADIKVDLIEKNSETGGNLNNWHQLFPNRRDAKELREQLASCIKHPNIQLHPNTTPIRIVRNDDHSFDITLSNQSLVKSEAVLLATGFTVFDAHRKEEYGYGIYDNVTTSVELENFFTNHTLATSTGKAPQRIGLIHCVGSRDEKICNHHCSKLCCITAVKQAVELREMLPDAEIFCFYMDMRMFGPGYEELYREAQEKYNIKFVRGRLSEANENKEKQVIIKAEDTLVGKPIRMTLDLLVLMVGMESPESSRSLAVQFGLPLAPNGFIQVSDPHYGNNLTAIKNLFVAGCSSAPMNLTDTLADARSAAMHIISYLKQNKT